MTTCSFCGHDNIEGSDLCDACEQPLTEEHLPTPATAVERDLLNDRIRVLAPKAPISVSGDTPVGAVLELLVEKKIGCVIVADADSVAGIFSERDALRRLGSDAAKLAGHPVSEFMTPQVESLEETAKVAFAVQRMDLGGYRHIPIVDSQGRPTGIISARDILRYLAERMVEPMTPDAS